MRLRGTLLLDLTASEEEIWKGVDKKRRGDIASVPSAKIEEGPNSEWVDLLVRRMADHGDILDKASIEEIMRRPNHRLYTAWHKGKLISGELFNTGAVARGLQVGNRRAMRLLYSATEKDEDLSSKIHAFLVWYTILEGKKLGCSEYDFGGYNHFRREQEGVNAWKMKFGGNIWWMMASGEPGFSQLLDEARAVNSLDPAKVCFWFDDGHASLHKYALPIMKSWGIKPIVALVAGRVGQRLEASGYSDYQIMNESQLRDIMDAGWEIASHGMTHRSFTTLSLDEAEKEFIDSKAWIEEHLGITPTKFAAPYSWLSTEQRNIAKKHYPYVRPNLPPRPPQKDGVHAIFHQIVPNPEGILMMTAIPTDPALLGWIRKRIGKDVSELMRRPGAAMDLNLSTNSTPQAVAFYHELRGLQPAEKVLLPRFITANTQVLELGAGGGRVTKHLKNLTQSLTVSDLSPKMVKALCEKGIEASVVNAMDIPYPDEQFDVVVFSFNGLDELSPESRRVKALKEIHRVLKVGGTLIMSAHNSRWADTHPKRVNPFEAGYYEYKTQYGFIVIRFISEEEQRQQFAETGFRVVEVAQHEPDAPWIYYVAQKDVTK
jgi:ubiquinone/menaquinone biosynthesis C-methylase UbiE/peptidoglycan/xylan/chitin deacetylase (PgdA/CDA1 family)